MTLALLLSDIPRSFNDQKHFNAHIPFGDISHALVCENAAPLPCPLPAGTMPAQKAAGRRSVEQMLVSEAVWAFFFFLFQKGKIQEPHSLAPYSSRM